jgi:NH3-dependent NAD+ synthetase
MSMRLTPTDGNGVSKSDCDQFGLENYEQVDDVLITMYYRSGFEQAFSSNSDQYSRLIDDYNEQGVDKVMALHQNTEFKRKPAPIMPTREELEL